MNSLDPKLEFLKSLLTGFDEKLAKACASDDLFESKDVSHGRALLKDEWALRRNEIFHTMSTGAIMPSPELELSENNIQVDIPASNLGAVKEEAIVAEEEAVKIEHDDEEAVKIELDASESAQPVNGVSQPTESSDFCSAGKNIPKFSKAISPKKDQPSTSKKTMFVDSDSNDGYEQPVRKQDNNDFDLVIFDSDDEEAKSPLKTEIVAGSSGLAVQKTDSNSMQTVELLTQTVEKRGRAEIEAEPVLDDEDEELRKIIELSKQTAKEEEKRRSQCLPVKEKQPKGRKLKRAVIHDSNEESEDDQPRRKSINKRKRSVLSSDEDDEENCDSAGSLEDILQDLASDEDDTSIRIKQHSEKKVSPKKKAKRETKKKNVFLDSQAGGNKSALDLDEDEFDSEMDDFIDDSELPDTQSPIQSDEERTCSSTRLQQVSEIFDDSDNNEEDDQPCTSLASSRPSAKREGRSERKHQDAYVKLESKPTIKKKPLSTKKEETETKKPISQQSCLPVKKEHDLPLDFEPILEELEEPNAGISTTIVVEDLERTGTVEARMALKRIFGYDMYRPSQWKLINGVCRGEDQLGIMATGYGKSICFQMPSILLKKLTICISPLISLMKDQTMKLETFGVKAGLLGSSAKKADIKRVYESIDSQELRVLYLTPEFSVNNIDKIRDIHQRHAICCFAIDECHCVSQWGHDFRDEYRKLHKLRLVDRKIPFLAMTATATPAVRDDIAKNLRLISVCSIQYRLNSNFFCWETVQLVLRLNFSQSS